VGQSVDQSVNQSVNQWTGADFFEEKALSPREVFFAAKKSLPIAQACGHICAETICPYPPGIPTLLPGEPITAASLAYLQAIQAAGGIITGCSDPGLKTILVIEGHGSVPC
jgi:arginine decarboxylase